MNTASASCSRGRCILSYRIFSQRNDRLSIASLAAIYDKQWMPPSARECFEDACNQLAEHLDSPATVTFPNGYMRAINPSRFLDLEAYRRRRLDRFEIWLNDLTPTMYTDVLSPANLILLRLCQCVEDIRFVQR
ncbi:hypothetical protein [Bradyrhizobium tropiciagri]|uniref:hypothetical protein n=1 Tax=Bradyrhizobium tropiciagri TaxID=312253 RepID=UPI00067C6A68|nr:hypothetical protein [Bradyrhizobium tropiciagri]